jgi:hypothetical protein
MMDAFLVNLNELEFSETQSAVDAMEDEIKRIILEGLGDEAVKLIAESKMTKGARTKTPAEKEMAKERSKLVRRIKNLFKLLRNEIFREDISLQIDIDIPASPPSSPVDSIPSPAILGDSQKSFENAITIAYDPIDGEISEADVNRFANLRLESNQIKGGGERYMKALHLLDTFLPRIAGVCAVFDGFDSNFPPVKLVLKSEATAVWFILLFNWPCRFDVAPARYAIVFPLINVDIACVVPEVVVIVGKISMPPPIFNSPRLNDICVCLLCV